MANLQETVAKRFPDVEMAQGETLELNVSDKQLHDLVTTLRN